MYQRRVHIKYFIENPVIIGRLIIVKMLITAVYDIDNAVSPFASLVIIFEVTPPGQDASIIIPTAISFVIPIINHDNTLLEENQIRTAILQNANSRRPKGQKRENPLH